MEQSIDYSAFSSTETFRQITAKYHIVYLNIFLFILSLLSALILSPYIGLIILMIASFMVPIIFVRYKYTQHKERLKKFASANDWTYGSPIFPFSLPPSIKNSAPTSMLYDYLLSGNYNSIPFNLFNLGTELLVAQIKFSTKLPEFYIAPSEILMINPPVNYTKVELEGNFQEYFSLLVPNGSQVDVLSYIAPDVMLSMIRNNHTQSIDSKDGYVWVTNKITGTLEEEIKELLIGIESLNEQFYRKSQ